MNINKFKLLNKGNVGNIKINKPLAMFYFVCTHALVAFFCMLLFNMIKSKLTVLGNINGSIYSSYAFTSVAALTYIIMLYIEIKLPVKRYHTLHKISHYLVLTTLIPLMMLVIIGINDPFALIISSGVLGFIFARETQISGHYFIYSKKYSLLLVSHIAITGIATTLANYIAHPIVLFVSLLALIGLTCVNLKINKPIFTESELKDYNEWLKEEPKVLSNQAKKKKNKFNDAIKKNKVVLVVFMIFSGISILISQYVINFIELSYTINFIGVAAIYLSIALLVYFLKYLKDKMNIFVLWLFLITLIGCVIPAILGTYTEVGLLLCIAIQGAFLIYLTEITYINTEVAYNLFNTVREVANLVFILTTLNIMKVEMLSGDVAVMISVIACIIVVCAYFVVEKLKFQGKWDEI